MNGIKRFCILLITIMLVIPISAYSQEDNNDESSDESFGLFIGFQPTISSEPTYYAETEWDTNIIPLVFGITLNHFIDLKFVPFLNLFLPSGNLRHLGLEINAPIYFLDIKNEIRRKTWFIAPVIAVSHDLLEIDNQFDNVITLAVETGYTFYWKSDFELKLGGQFGVSFIFEDQWSNANPLFHIGVKVSFGKWFYL